MNSHREGFAVILLATLASASGSGYASDQQRLGEALEEVVVTAQKRSSNIQDVPVSVTAVTSADIDKLVMLNLQSVKVLTPNMYLEEALQSASNVKLFMRGVGVDNTAFSFDTPIGIFVDDVYYARTVGTLVDLLDVERIEVLRGPQSVLFGRNNSAGSVRVVSNAPDLNDFRFAAGVDVGSKDQRNVRAMVNAPLIDSVLALRLSASTRSNDGWLRDLTNNVNRQTEDIDFFRAALLYEPSDRWQFTLRGDLMRDGSLAREASDFRINADGDIYTITPSPEARFDRGTETWGTSLKIDGDFGGLRFSSITAYRNLDNKASGDVDGRPDVRSFEVEAANLDEHQFTQEVFMSGNRLGGRDINWIVGAFYFDEYNNYEWALRIFSDPNLQVFEQNTDSVAGYVQLDIPLTDRWNLSGGTRYTTETKDFSAIQFFPDGTQNPAFAFDESLSADVWTWQLSTDYALSEDVLLFGRAATGFRSGGFNGNARTQPEITSGKFDIEESISVEAGIKSELFDDRLRVNASYYWVEYTGLQFAITRTDGITTTNAEATVHGLEIEARALPVEGLEITGTLGTMFDDIKDSNLQLKNTPEFTGNLGMYYTFPVSLFDSAGSIRLGADVTYRTDSFNDTSNREFTNTGDYEIINASIAFQTQDGRWSVRLAGLNLTDTFVPIHTFNIGDGFISSVHFTNTPRRWLLSLDYRM